jgi:hypothetical protein
MAPRSTTTVAYVGTSYGVTPKSSVPSDRRSSSEPAMSSAAPLATTSPREQDRRCEAGDRVCRERQAEPVDQDSSIDQQFGEAEQVRRGHGEQRVAATAETRCLRTNSWRSTFQATQR